MAKRRPLGVTILGSLAVVGGVILLILSLISLLAFFAVIAMDVSPDVPENTFLVSSLVNLIVGAILLGVGNGLLNLRPWAWWLAFIVAIVGLLRAIFALLVGAAQATITAFVGALFGLVLLLVFLGYLLSVSKHFR